MNGFVNRILKYFSVGLRKNRRMMKLVPNLLLTKFQLRPISLDLPEAILFTHLLPLIYGTGEVPSRDLIRRVRAPEIWVMLRLATRLQTFRLC